MKLHEVKPGFDAARPPANAGVDPYGWDNDPGNGTPLPGDKPFSFNPDGSGLPALKPIRDLIKKHGAALASICGADAIIELAAIAISEPVTETYRFRSGAEELREMFEPRREPAIEIVERFADSLRRKGV